MTPLLALLFLGSGMVLGLLGGGGSILAVPLLVHGAGLGPRPAIAASLLVVGLTALIGLFRHHWKGNVRWRTGVAFGLAAMVGSFGGGRLAAYLPEKLLLMLFAGLMVVVGVRMLRGPASARAETEEAAAEAGGLSVPATAVLGAAIGLTTGLLGAGGGFLIVPALVLGAGLAMPAAVGTSLLVIVMNSAAGLAGHLGHTQVDFRLALTAAAASIVGVLLGVNLGGRISPLGLRRVFGALVLVVAAGMIAADAPAPAALPPAWSAPVAGLGIGLLVLAFAYLGGQRLGVSTGFFDACKVAADPTQPGTWRIPFLVGIVAGGWLAAQVAGGPTPGFAVPMLDPATHWPLALKAVLFTFGGACLGYGARLAGGCTSGHAIVGCAQLSPASAKAAALFMVGAIATTRLVLQVFGTYGS